MDDTFTNHRFSVKVKLNAVEKGLRAVPEFHKWYLIHWEALSLDDMKYLQEMINSFDLKLKMISCAQIKSDYS